MSQIGASLANGAVGATADDEVTAQGPESVHNCSRIGLVANPPSFSLTEWFRASRRR